MQLYDIFSSATFNLIEEIFPAKIIQRAIGYVKDGSVTSIKYDHLKNSCTALVSGSKKYKVAIGLTAENEITVNCNCPGAAELTPECKHAAATLIIIVEFFSDWRIVTPMLRQYYEPILRKAFDHIEQEAATVAVNQVDVKTKNKLPAFKKPTIIFIKASNLLFPQLLFVDFYNQQSLSSFARYPIQQLDVVLDKIFSYSNDIDYFVFCNKGLVQINFSGAYAVCPEWRLQSKGSNVELQLFYKNVDQALVPCLPLGNAYVIDLINNIIVPTKIINKTFYGNLNTNLMSLIYDGSVYQASVGHILQSRELKKLLRDHYRFTEALATISAQDINENLGFLDYDLKNYTSHFAILDEQAQPIEPQNIHLESRVMLEYGFLHDRLYLRCVQYGNGTKFFIHPSALCERFLHIIELVTTTEKARNLFTAMLDLYKGLGDASVTDETCRRLFFQQMKELSVEKRTHLFKTVCLFWRNAQRQVLVKLFYNETTKTFEKVVMPESDNFISLLHILAYCTTNKISISIQADNLLVIFASRDILGDLSAYLRAVGIGLYKDTKKIVQRSLDVEIDMNSGGNDWFALAPTFYEKDTLLNESEWQKILAHTESSYESETEVQFFDQKTSAVLDSLRTIKHDYQTSSTDKRKVYFKIPRLHIFTLLSLNKSGARLKMLEEDKNLIASLYNFTTISALSLPEKLCCTLRDYQRKGYDWLGFLYQHKFGACLADEMGLGKTIQAIAFLAGIYEEKIKISDAYSKRQHLIVAPATVIGNWQQEIQRFYPSFLISLYLGPQRKLKLDGIDIILTTYDVVRVDIDELKKIPFHVIIFDEAQAIKNQQSQKANAVFQLQALFKVCLTGTPLENNAKELCSIINLALPGLLPEDSVVVRLVKKGEYQALSEKISPFMLRRTKQEHLHDLPAKTETNKYLEMTKKQKGFYGAIVDEIKQEVYQAYREKTKAQAGIIALTALLRLRQICITPALINNKIEKTSPKIEYLLEEITTLQNQKIPLLVFSQFTKALDILVEYLEKNKVRYLRIDGSTPVLQRKKIVEEFQTSDNVFVLVLSLKTGGVGLNLTRAHVVYHLDPWWNPAVENQASDRVHRIGQKNDVKIVRLLMKDSIEEKMLVLKQQKAALFDAIMQGTASAKTTGITKQDFDFLLS